MLLLTLAGSEAPSVVAGESSLSEPARREIVRTLEGLEEQWIGVYVTHDLSFLEGIIAFDLVATLSDGTMRGKREHIAAYPADFEAFASVVSSDVKVHVFTPEAAVVTGLYTAQLRHPEGKEASGRYRFTDTWLRRAGTWQCVATQETHVP